MFTEDGISYREEGKKEKPHEYSWSYRDIQRLELQPSRLRLLTYQDIRWRLGADRAHEFTGIEGGQFQDAYELIRDRLDQRLVADIADKQVQPLWELPVKRLGRITGSEGRLAFAADRIVYDTGKKGAAHTWRHSDIENVSSPAPFELTITSNRKDFNFQLKQALPRDRYNELWRRLNGREQGE